MKTGNYWRPCWMMPDASNRAQPDSVSRWPVEIEWLLQVLNDVRLGSWIALGSPDLEREDQLAVTIQTLPHLQRMELAGRLEMFFLNAISGAA
jgi:hypothetical protein